ncbi:hypothetical protein [Parabacteroides distasonis]|uniref:hypothetical protein n=1 Tax=Parabacteroides distasonis TaxID=823 RepID=UPI00216587C9|nr:hypothetical protein [Parabacteroides distasonis]MCS2604278.1 hypothetical protein [Parabacteroides distasonis]
MRNVRIRKRDHRQRYAGLDWKLDQQLLYWKNFDLTMDLQFVWGVETMQQFYHSTYDRFGITNGLSNILYDAYNGTNPNTMQQAVYLCQLRPCRSGYDSRFSMDRQWFLLAL